MNIENDKPAGGRLLRFDLDMLLLHLWQMRRRLCAFMAVGAVLTLAGSFW